MRELETFKLLDRYRYARSNFIAAYHGGSAQNRKRELGKSNSKGLLARGLLAKPIQQKDSGNYRYSPSIYELTDKSKKLLDKPTKWNGERNFWHQLMVADIVLSFEIASKQRGLIFRTQKEIIGDKPLQFEAHISHEFAKHTERYNGALAPDALFAINNTCFVLEADRQSEPIYRDNFKASSYLRKILQYRDVLKTGSYKTLIPNMVVLNITTSVEHAKNIQTFMFEDLKMQSRSFLFKGIPVLGSRDEYPQPLTHLLDEPFDRAGYPPFVISKEIKGR